MESSYDEYSPHLMQTILTKYRKGIKGCGFLALAKQYNIKGGPTLLRYWYRKWDGTEASLTKQSGGDRRSILTSEEKKKHVQAFIVKKSKVEAAKYEEVRKNVENKTGKSPKLRTVQDYGKSFKITNKKRKRVLKSQGHHSPYFSSCPASPLFCRYSHCFCVLGTEEYRNFVTTFRKKCQRIAKKRLVFMDGSGLRSEPRQLTGLAPSGQTPRSTADKAEKYEPRIDIMGAISFNGPLACETKTSKQRRATPNRRKGKMGVKGYTKDMVKKFLKNQLAPQIEAMKVKEVIVCMDKGLSFKPEEAKEELKLGGAENLKDVWILPTNTAKFR